MKKLLKMRRVMFACLMTAVMTALASCEAAPSESSQPESTPASNVSEISTPTEESEKPEEETAAELAVGNSATLGDWGITVTSWEIVPEIQDSTGFLSFTPTEGNQFIVISATVTNNGTEAATFLPSFALNNDVTAKIYYNGEYEYSSTNLLGEESELHDASLNPLTNKSGTITYDVPSAVTAGTEPLVITFEAGTESITFKLR